MIPIETVLELFANNEPFKLVEVLSEEDYKKGHILGAISIPLNKLGKQAPKQLQKDETIIVYCGSYSCGASTKAAKKLKEMGYENVLDFKASKKGWVDAGFPLIS
jgi:rhodanese-related sulfurtransferase